VTNPHALIGNERFNTTAVDCVNCIAGNDGIPFDDNDNPADYNGDPIDNDHEERFENPVKYFEDLESLEIDVAYHSALRMYQDDAIIGDHNLGIHFPDPSVLESIVAQSDDDLLALCKETVGKTAIYAERLLHLLRCRIVMFAVYNNCCKLIKAQFGGHLINFLKIMQGRKNVAKLVSYKASSIKSLAEGFDHALSRYLHQTLLSKTEIRSDFVEDALQHINHACNACLHELGLWNREMDEQPYEVSWYCATQTLDLAVLSFAGAHNQDFAQYLRSEPSYFDVPAPFVNLPVQIKLHPRHLQCLDELFYCKPVWVFHPSSMTNTANEPLYLSVNMRDFSHIWGPVWGFLHQMIFKAILSGMMSGVVPLLPYLGQRMIVNLICFKERYCAIGSHTMSRKTPRP